MVEFVANSFSSFFFWLTKEKDFANFDTGKWFLLLKHVPTQVV